MLKKKEINKKAIIICGINILLVVLLWTVGLSDETKDDLGVQLFISGNDGVATYYHQWASAFRMLSTFYLQRLIPQIAWNYAIQVILIFISISIICREILDKMVGQIGIPVAVFTAVILFYQSISVFNFTRTAALIMCAAVCLILREEKREKWCGVLLFAYGITFRISIICISVGFVVIILLWRWSLEEGAFADKLRAIWRTFMIPIAVAYALALLVELIGQIAMTEDPEWRKIYDRCLLSGEVMDFGLNEYADAEAVYKQYGISENDYEMVKTRFSNSDTGYFTDEMYQLIIDYSSKKWEMSFSAETVEEWYHAIVGYLFHNCFGWYILGILFLAFVFYKGKKKWIPLLVLLCLGAYLVLFCVMGRVVNRVTFSVYLCAGITMLICYNSENLLHSDNGKVIAEKLRLHRLQYVLYLVIAVFTVAMGMKYHRSVNEEIAGIYDYMEDHQEVFYFYTQFSQYKAIDHLLLSDDYWDTGNSFYSSDYDFAVNSVSKYRQYGIESIYKDAVDSEVIRFIDQSRIDMIERYIQEHYCDSARAVQVDEINDYKVYKIVSG